MKPFEYAMPSEVEQALALLKEARGRAVPKAGGIDLLDRMKLGIDAPPRLVNLNAVPSLRYLRVERGALRLGPTTTLAEIAAHPEVRARFAALAQAAGSAANSHVRNMATVAGNLLQRPRCWYYRSPDFACLKKGGTVCFSAKGANKYHAILGGGPSWIVHPSTMATALVALGASVHLGRAGEKPRELPLEKLFVLPSVKEDRENVLAPDELILGIDVPAPPEGARSVYAAAKERQEFDWPLGEVAVVLRARGHGTPATPATIDQARVVLGAAAPVPWRAIEAEKALQGARFGAEAARAAGRAAVQGARPLADNGYKVPLFQVLVERAVLAAGGAPLPGMP